MGVAIFDDDEISHDSYIVPKGSSNPLVTIYPRTIGGLIQESGVVEKIITLKSYLIPPKLGNTRSYVEDFMHNLNEQIGGKEATLECNGNQYLKANVKGINYDTFITKDFIRYGIDFELNDQNDGEEIRQLDVPDLLGFSRGRTITFETQLSDLSYRTFTFWHNFDQVQNLETNVTISHSEQYGGAGKVIRNGGFENIICNGWIIGPETNNRKNLEAYFYNIMNAVVGRLGTIDINNGERIITNAFLKDMNPEDNCNPTLRYTLTFLASLQC